MKASTKDLCSSRDRSRFSPSSAEGSRYTCGDRKNSNEHYSHLGFWQPRTRVLLYNTGVPMT